MIPSPIDFLWDVLPAAFEGSRFELDLSEIKVLHAVLTATIVLD